jgi:predicted RNA-binding Zn-ribbon protein involved in translation (DUF1610 family)
MIVQCTSCGQTWQRDPILEVACPTCHVHIGRRCKRPSGHQASDYHIARNLLAIKHVPGYGHCPAAHPPTAVAPSLRTASQLALQL